MDETIRVAETLTNEEGQQLFGWKEDIFGSAGWKMVNRPPELHFVMSHAALAVSHLTLGRDQVTVGNQTLLVAGVGGVLTRGDAQGQGCAGRLLRHAMEFSLREWSVDAGLLFCFDRLVSFYTSLGWQLLPPPVLVEQPGGQIEYPANTMAFPRAGCHWPPGQVQVQGLPW